SVRHFPVPRLRERVRQVGRRRSHDPAAFDEPTGGTMIRRLSMAGVAVALVVTASTALAGGGSPHFVSASGSINSAGSLVASFKEAGLDGAGGTTDITLTVASAQATYACINRGEKHPKAANKETVSGSLETTGSFPVRNGQTTGWLTVGPPGPGSF